MSSVRSTTALAGPDPVSASRGRAGIIGLIVADSSILAVVVVAYLFYICNILTCLYTWGVL